MKKRINNLPIGVFDSGVGGLTVVKEILKKLPNENIIYFGDTARVPYGPKSSDTIKHFALQDAAFLISKKVKLIVVACNSVSSNAMPILQKHYKLPIIDVLKPNAEYAAHSTKNNIIGIIGTHATIESGAYEKYINKINPLSKVIKIPTPLLVPIAEEGWSNHKIAYDILNIYLAPLIKGRIDTLILGCTHYPLFEKPLKSIVGKNIKIINSAKYTAKTVKNILANENMLNNDKKKGDIRFYLSDIPRNFACVAKQFLKMPVSNVKKINIENY